MHWLVERLQQVQVQALAMGGVGSVDEARPRFRTALRHLVEALATRDGVSASFACHEGLLLEAAGGDPDFEALAAMGQGCAAVARDAAATLALGEVRQLVLVGATHKLALFILGQLAVGVLCAEEVNLATSLATAPTNPRVH